MKRTIGLCRLPLLFALLPMTGWTQIPGACKPVYEEIQSVEKQLGDLHGEPAEVKQKRDALVKKKQELSAQFEKCARGEFQKQEAKMQSLASEGSKAFNKEVQKLQSAGILDQTGVVNAARTQGLVAVPPMPDSGSAPPPSYSSSLPSSGSGRTREQRAAALAAVNAELDRMPYVLPQANLAPAKSDILKLARDRNASARKQFGPDDLSAYSKAVTWVPSFEGLNVDKEKARQYSLLVAAATNYFDKPNFVIALASAVFPLDPQSTVNANNFASAIVAAGERLYPAKAQAKELAPYRKDAESCFLYAMAISMKNGAWTDESFTAILNLGNLYIDMGKLDEARSLFQVARKLKPFSWDAARGMAAYFHAVGKADKALAILEDDNLDKPVMLMVAKKSAKVLEKSDSAAGIPLGSPEKVYEDGIKTMDSEPVATAADFIAQIDQSTRNKMRYFVEHLPPEGSFTAPPIKTLTQYASLKAISSPQGISALKDFMEMLQLYSISSYASAADEQLKMLSGLGLQLNPGVDLNDVARNPGKYANSKRRPKVQADKKELMANIEKWRKQAEEAKRDLATGKTASSVALAAQVDPFFTILQLDPQAYADPMNVIIQKHNFAVLNRKTNLYNGYLFSVNKRTRQAVEDIAAQYQRKVADYAKIEAAALEQLDKEQAAAEASDSSPKMEAEWALRRHNVHVQYFNSCNAAAEAAFGSATNVASVAYVQKIKPKAEAYYYDVIRHVALISDPEVRKRKDAELNTSIHSALVFALNTVATAHGSFKYHHEWECGCNVGQLLQERDAEQAAQNEEENARIQRNKAAKKAFDSRDIPESTPLFKKLDAYGVDLHIPFIPFLSGRISCARTIVKLNTEVLPIPNIGQLFGSMTRNEFTGATRYDGGVTIGIKKEVGSGEVSANFGLSGSVSTDGNWNVSDYSITPKTGLSVKAGATTVSVGGELTFGPNGLQDSDFSAGISQDFKNGFGMEGKTSFEVSSKRECKFSGEVTDSIMPKDADSKSIVKSPWENIPGEDHFGKSFQEDPPTDQFHKRTKTLWSGKFKI